MGLTNIRCLSLRNIVVGGNTNMSKNANKLIENILVSCPHLIDLDLSTSCFKLSSVPNC